MTTTTREAIESEIRRIESAPATRIQAFAAARQARLAELREALSSAASPVASDPRVETALRNARGGDRFGR